MANSIGSRKRIAPPHRLASMLTPIMVEGTVIASVATAKNSPAYGLMPLTYMWCPQTIRLSTAIA